MKPESYPSTIIRTGEGALLATAAATVSEDGLMLGLSSIAQPGALLAYYFAKGGRAVRVELGGRHVVFGRLRTHWAGSKRAWGVALRDEVESAATVSTHPSRVA